MTARRRTMTWAALAMGASLLAGCGATGDGAPGGAVTSVSDPRVGPTATDLPSVVPETVPTDSDLRGTAPTSVPVGVPPPEFAQRAELVAAAVRRAGVPEPSARPVLQGSWAVDEGFDTDAQKMAWGTGHVDLAPSVPPDATGTGTIRTADGTSRDVALVGVRAALNRALEGALDAPSDCSGIPAADCRLVVTRAELADTEVATSVGRLSLPVWRLTIDGLSHPISVIAAADAAVTRPAHELPLPGLPDAPAGTRGIDLLEKVDGTSLRARIAHGACDPNLVGHVVEFDDLVVVGATSDAPPADTICPAIYLSTPADLTLVRPLGSRVVIDAVTGRPRELGVPVL